MITITGANGQLGQAIVEHLLTLIPADQIVASVREPEKATVFAARGVEVRQGDFAEPDTLKTAFSGSEQVLIVSANVLGERALILHKAAIQAAYDAGAKRVLYTSHMGARADSPFAPASSHHATETVLAQTKMPFTSLRHGFYVESAFYLIGQGIEDGEIRVPEDGPVSWTARADLAEADAIILADEGTFDGITPALTAPEAFTMAEVAEIASEVIGREIKHTVISDDDWLAEKIAQGMAPQIAKNLLGAYQAARRGDFAEVNPALEKLLGRRPQTMRDLLAGKYGGKTAV